MSEVLANGLFALLGAIIGGFIAAGTSVWATRAQIKKQDEQNELNNKRQKELDENLRQEKRRITKNIVETFLINEIKYNLNQLDSIKPSLFEKHGSNSHNSIHTDFNFKIDEYEKCKFKLMEITTLETLNVVEIYQMFYMLNEIHKGSRLSRFNENEFGFIKNRYKLADDFVTTYYKEKLKNFS
ncbi:hypothetical protein MKY22_02510 [Exiguobacterium sp. FSL W8-0210]|uniref:hypothetical protein n=1 Tax=Exiguobacterium sp. FSL W8-0210 TaxID=2921598 RepID=UPI0030F93B1F